MDSVFEQRTEKNVLEAVAEVVYDFKDWEEIGSSDITAMCKSAVRDLGLTWEDLSEDARQELRQVVRFALSRFFH